MQTPEEIFNKGELIADLIGIKVDELDLHDLCNYHLPLNDVFEAMDLYAASCNQTLLDEVNRLNGIVEKQGNVINALRDLE